MNKWQDILINSAEKINIKINDEQLNKFDKYLNLLLTWNNKINLTAITQPEEIAIKHFLDSITIFNYIDIPENASVIDVGTGAGFPGIPLKIMRDDINLILLDSLNKRLIFLNDVINNLNIKATLIHSRAEDAGKKTEYREKYDIVTARAVASLNQLCEYCLPFVKINGKFIAMKGDNANNEIINANNAIKMLSSEIENIFTFKLNDNYLRTIINIKKISHIPAKYPRNPAQITKKPL